MIFSCEVCHIYTTNRSDYKKHIETKKHMKLTKINVSTVDENASNDDKNDIYAVPIPENQIVLNVSELPNTKKRRYNTNAKRLKLSSYNKDQVCKYCGIGYSYSSGLYRHMKKCAGIPQNENQSQQTNAVVPNMNGVINTLLCENKEFKKLILDVIKTNSEIIKSNQELVTSQHDATSKMLEMCSKTNAASVTNNIYNHKGDNNNHFNLNVFLNEKCKDAMNMSDFVNSIEVTIESMEYLGEHGYVDGISTIFIDNLKNTEISKRPIHCSDRKREILYVKDADRWERDGVNSQKLKNAVKIVGHKHAGLVNKWADIHPGCEKSYSIENDRYLSICRNISDGDDDKILKVVKNIAKETVIEKDALM